MTESTAPSAPQPSKEPAKVPAIDQMPTGFAFTDSGCRSEVRFGALLIMMAVFMWLFLGPQWCAWLSVAGGVCLLIGVPWQAFESMRVQRPGYPIKLAVVFCVLGGFLLYDNRFRVRYDAAMDFHYIGWMVLLAGLWMLAWWPVARKSPRASEVMAS